MSSDDFRDLVSEFDHSGETNLEFYRWSPPTIAFGDIVPGTGGYAQIVLGGPWAYIADAPQIFRDQLPEGKRERESILVWQWSELLNGTITDPLRSVTQSTHGKADLVRDVDRGKWFAVEKNGDFRRIAKVNAAICTLIDGDPL
jgi:hypothetical protein